MFTNATNKFWSLVMNGLVDVDWLRICIQVCMWLGFQPLIWGCIHSRILLKTSLLANLAVHGKSFIWKCRSTLLIGKKGILPLMSITGVIGSSLYTSRFTMILILTNNVTIKFTLSVGSDLNHSQREYMYHLSIGTRTLQVKASFVHRTRHFRQSNKRKNIERKNCPKVLKLITLKSAQVELCGVHLIQNSQRDITYHI